MKLILKNIKVPIESDTVEEYLSECSKKLKLNDAELSFHSILSKSLDIRNQQQFYYKLVLVVDVPSSYANKAQFERYEEPDDMVKSRRAMRSIASRPIIIGFGPAGMFAAIEFIRNGIKPIVFERGRPIEQRSADVQTFIDKRVLDTQSNIQFGEGGAGAFSDGKLFSRRNNNTSYVSRVLDTFIEFGAPEEIGYIAKPHLGTDVLCEIVKNIRAYVIENGGDLHYKSRLTELIIDKEQVVGVKVNDSAEYLSESVFFATGHSARDTYRSLSKAGVALEQKQISVGVRIEHPATSINLLRYGSKYQNHPDLEAATYSINYTNKEARTGAYTFCMCPGGEIVNASSEEGGLVVNGMSYSDRGLPYSNAGIVVPCAPELYGCADPLAGIRFQQQIEKKAYELGGNNWNAPAQTVYDFLGITTNSGLGGTSFQMGLKSGDLNEILPQHIITQLTAAFMSWKEAYPLFISDEAMLIGVETRTSSPVKISRNEYLESTNIKNLYPIGEGSGYTGGITSSAADAIRAVDKFLFGE